MRIRSLAAAGTILVVALALAACGSGDRADVLGEVYERPSPTTSLVAVKPVEVLSPVPPATSPPPASVAAAADVPRATSTNMAAPPPAPAPPPLQVTREFSDNAATIVITGGKLEAAVSSTTVERGPANPFAFYVSLPVDAELLTIGIDLANTGTTSVQLPAGLDLAVSISRNGQPWRVEQVTDPALTAIPPGGTWSKTITVPAGGDGSYDITGWVDVVHG